MTVIRELESVTVLRNLFLMKLHQTNNVKETNINKHESFTISDSDGLCVLCHL